MISNFAPGKTLGMKPGQSCPKYQNNLLLIGQTVLNHVVKTTKQRMIENIRVISRGNYHAVRLILFDHLQKTIEHAPNFTHIVGYASLRTDSIEFVKK